MGPSKRDSGPQETVLAKEKELKSSLDTLNLKRGSHLKNKMRSKLETKSESILATEDSVPMNSETISARTAF